MPFIQLSIYLLKAHITEFDDAVRTEQDEQPLSSYDIANTFAFTGKLFVRSSHSSVPTWVEYVQTGIADVIANVFNSNSAALLLIRSLDRMFAITFGYGRNLLDLSSVERDFGLKVVLNSVNPESIRSIDMQAIEDMSLNTRKQASAKSDLDAFGIDIRSDILRAVTGEAEETDFAKRITGKDGLWIYSDTSFTQLAAKCATILDYYNRNTYRLRYPWVDNIQMIHNSHIIDTLNQRLITTIRAGDLTHFHMCPPDPFDWRDVDGFRYGTGRRRTTVKPELNLAEYLNEKGNIARIDIAELCHDRVKVRYTTSGQDHARWTVYDCLVWEADIDGRKYILSGGDWFEIEQNYFRRNEDIISTLSMDESPLPHVDTATSENDYIDKAIRGNPMLYKMHLKTTRCMSNNSPIEICDIISSNGDLIHVKIKAKSPAHSHFFFQGSLSAEAFVREQEFRRFAHNELLANGVEWANIIPIGNRPDTNSFRVIYAFLTRNRVRIPMGLPFFSKVALAQTAERLRTLGYRVFAVGIPI